MTNNEDDCGYELDNPKSPTWAERMAEHADFLRKKRREDELLKQEGEKNEAIE